MFSQDRIKEILFELYGTELDTGDEKINPTEYTNYFDNMIVFFERIFESRKNIFARWLKENNINDRTVPTTEKDQVTAMSFIYFFLGERYLLKVLRGLQRRNFGTALQIVVTSKFLGKHLKLILSSDVMTKVYADAICRQLFGKAIFLPDESSPSDIQDLVTQFARQKEKEIDAYENHLALNKPLPHENIPNLTVLQIELISRIGEVYPEVQVPFSLASAKVDSASSQLARELDFSRE